MRAAPLVSLLILAGCRPSSVSQLALDVDVPEAVACGQAFVGFEGTCPVTVTNRTLRAVSVSLQSAAPFELPSEVEVPGGASTDVPVRFHPTSAGVTMGVATARFEGHGVEVRLSGEGVVVPPCAPSDDCREQRFEPQRGCVESVRADGAPCGATNACLVNATCRGGQCVGAARSCDDKSVCTADACDPSRGCLPEAVACAPSANPCLTSVCEARLGCVTQPVLDGVSCGANDCHLANVCVGGQCVERAAPEGSACAPATACRGAGRCSATRSCEAPPPGRPVEAFRVQLPPGRVVQTSLVSTTGVTYFSHRVEASTAPASVVLVSIDRQGRSRFEVDLTAETPGLGGIEQLMLDAPNHRLFLAAFGRGLPRRNVLRARESRTGVLVWQRDLRALGISTVNPDDDGQLFLQVHRLALVGGGDVLAHVVEGYGLHQVSLSAFDGRTGVERWRAQRPGHGELLVSGDGQTWGRWAPCDSGEFRFSRIEATGQSSIEVQRLSPVAVLGDSAVGWAPDGGLAALSPDLQRERRFPLSAWDRDGNYRHVRAQGDELTLLVNDWLSNSISLVRTREAQVRWTARVDSPPAWPRRLDLVADGGAVVSPGFPDGGAALVLLSNEGREVERCLMGERLLSGITDDLLVTTEKTAVVGLRFPGVVPATSGLPSPNGVDGTHRWR
ncbi:MAG: hypothetical protein INH41_10240 [Myxococcaceae bacterium]|jgi:hypothetical protein|nr:hypothetical protein [Myxococcaceae bacterium]MCA3012762.1 hypothetical protein [Myxococcaceae bacterium]